MRIASISGMNRGESPCWPGLFPPSFSVLYAVAGVSALLGAVAVLPVKGVR